MQKRTKQLALGTLIAAGLGYVAGILTAPKSGRETRKDIQNAALKAKSEAEKRLKDLHSELGVLIDQGKVKAKQAKASAKSGLLDALMKAQVAKEKAREMLSAVHEGDTENVELQNAINDSKSAITNLKKYLRSDTGAKGKTGA